MPMERKVCVLIDDDADDREAFAIAMAAISSEFDVVLIENAMDAIRRVRDKQLIPDVIFLDLNMPGVNGYEFLVYLKGQIRYMRIPVVVYSNSGDPEEIRRTTKLGAAAFFKKPVKAPELRTSLQELLASMELINKVPADR